MTASRLAACSRQACGEIAAVFERLDDRQFEALLGEIAAARRIVLHGVGREGLMMRALSMRLYHIGLDAHPLGDMTAPPLGAGDLLVVSDGPGRLTTVQAVVEIARAAGARIGLVTAQPQGASARLADTILVLPAQTMADDIAAAASTMLPMGSVYEGAQFIAFEILVLMLRERLQVSAEAMRARHTNLE